MKNPFGAPASPHEERGWRVGHRGRDQMYYEERHRGQWERLAIDGEMLTGRAHHVIYFPTPAQWSRYPAWAQGRRDEIIARIKSEFREPDYEYHGDQRGEAPAAASPAPPAAPPPPDSAPRAPVRPRQGRGVLLLAVLLLLALAAGMGWVVGRGLDRGETRLPIKQATLRRAVVRQQEPAMFWTVIGLYAAVGAGALTLGLLGAREWRRMG